MPSLLASNAHLWLLNTMLSQIFLAVGTAVVEPTGAGKTGIINLAAFAALGPSAPPGSACKVLVVTPNIGELRAAAAAEHVSNLSHPCTCIIGALNAAPAAAAVACQTRT